MTLLPLVVGLMTAPAAGGGHSPSSSPLGAYQDSIRSTEAIWTAVLGSYARRAHDSVGSRTRVVLHVAPPNSFRSSWLDSLVHVGILDALCPAPDRARCATAPGTIVLVLRAPVLATPDSATVVVTQGQVSGGSCTNDWTEAQWSVRREGDRWAVVGLRYGANSLEECAG